MHKQVSLTLTFDDMAACIAFVQARNPVGGSPKTQEIVQASPPAAVVAPDPFAATPTPAALEFTRDVVEGALKPYSLQTGNQLAAMMGMLGGLGVKTIPDLAAHPKAWAPIIAFTKAPGAETAGAIKAAFA